MTDEPSRPNYAALVEFMERRCIGVDAGADAARWKLIHAARAVEPTGEPMFSRSDVEALIAIAIAGKDYAETIQQATARVIEEARGNVSRAITDGFAEE